MPQHGPPGNPHNLPIAGLRRNRPPEASQMAQDVSDPIAQAQALMERNRLLAGQSEPSVPPSSASPGEFTFTNPDMPDIAGLINAMRSAGIRGQRTQDIELRPEAPSVDELTRRIDALLGQQR